MKERKYTKGKSLKSLDSVADRIHRGEWFWLHGRPKHPAFVAMMTIGTLMGYVATGTLFVALDRTRKTADPEPTRASIEET